MYKEVEKNDDKISLLSVKKNTISASKKLTQNNSNVLNVLFVFCKLTISHTLIAGNKHK